MSRREDFDNGFWGDPDVYPLSPYATYVYIWTWTNTNCNLAGLYEVHPGVIADQTKLSEGRVAHALDELTASDLIAYDGRLMWVKGRIGRLGSKNPNVAKAIGKDLRLVNGHPFVDQLKRKYADVGWLQPAFGIPHG